MKRKLLVICGPTAVGKTSLGIMVAKKLGGEILSADSRQVYKGLDVLTGKDIGKSRFEVMDLRLKKKSFTVGYYLVRGVKIWGLDIVDPGYWFNVSDYVQYAKVVLKNIWQRERLPVLVGGTGMYIKTLLNSPETIHLRPNWKLRRDLERLAVSGLQDRLKQVDSQRFDRMNSSDRLNPRRLIRAIEVGQNEKGSSNKTAIEDVDSLIIGLTISSRAALDKRIDERLKLLIENGAEKEVSGLLKKRVPLTNPALSSTGVGAFLTKLATGRKKLSDEDRGQILKQWQLADHRLARQQMTWFCHQLPVEWFDIKDRSYPRGVLKRIRNWYN